MHHHDALNSTSVPAPPSPSSHSEPHNLTSWLSQQQTLNSDLYKLLGHYSRDLPSLEPSEEDPHDGDHHQETPQHQHDSHAVTSSLDNTPSNTPQQHYTSQLHHQVKNDFQWLFLNRMEPRSRNLLERDLPMHELQLHQRLKAWKRDREEPPASQQHHLLTSHEIHHFNNSHNETFLKHCQFMQTEHTDPRCVHIHPFTRDYQFFHVNRYLQEEDNNRTTATTKLQLLPHVAPPIQCLLILHQMYLHFLLLQDGTEARLSQRQLSAHLGQLAEDAALSLRNESLPSIVPPVNQMEISFSQFLTEMKLHLPALQPNVFSWRNHLEFRKRFISKMMLHFNAQHKKHNDFPKPILVKRNHRYMLILGMRWRGTPEDDPQSYLEAKFRFMGLYQGNQVDSPGQQIGEHALSPEHFNNYPYYSSIDGTPCIPSDISPSGEEVSTTDDPPSSDQDVTPTPRVWSLYPSVNVFMDSQESLQLSADPHSAIPIEDEESGHDLLIQFLQENPLFVLNQLLTAKKTGDKISLRNPHIVMHRKMQFLDSLDVQLARKQEANDSFKLSTFIQQLKLYWIQEPQYKVLFQKLFTERNASTVRISSLFLPLISPFHCAKLKLHDVKLALVTLFPFLKSKIPYYSPRVIRRLQGFCLSLCSDKHCKKLMEQLFHLDLPLQQGSHHQEESVYFSLVDNMNICLPKRQYETVLLKSVVDWMQETCLSTTQHLDAHLNSVLAAIRANMFSKHRILSLCTLFLTGLYDPQQPEVLQSFTSYHIKQLLKDHPEFSPLISRSLSNPVQEPVFILNRVPPTTTQVLISFFLAFESLFVNRLNQSVKSQHENGPPQKGDSVPVRMVPVKKGTLQQGEAPLSLSQPKDVPLREQLIHAFSQESTSDMLHELLTIIARQCGLQDAQALMMHPLFQSTILLLIKMCLQVWQDDNSKNKTPSPVLSEELLRTVTEQLPIIEELFDGHEEISSTGVCASAILHSELIDLQDPNSIFLSIHARLSDEERKKQEIVTKLTRYWNFHWKSLCQTTFHSEQPTQQQECPPTPTVASSWDEIYPPLSDQDIDKLMEYAESLQVSTQPTHPLHVLQPGMLSDFEKIQHHANYLPSAHMTYSIPQSINPQTEEPLQESLQPQLPSRPSQLKRNDSNRTTFVDLFYDGFSDASLGGGDFCDVLLPGLVTNELGFMQLDTTSEEANHPIVQKSTLFASQFGEDELLNTSSFLGSASGLSSMNKMPVVKGTLENRRKIARELIDSQSKGSLLKTKINEYADRTTSSVNQTIMDDSPLKPKPLNQSSSAPHDSSQSHIMHLYYCRSLDSVKTLFSPVMPSYDTKQDVRRELELLRSFLESSQPSSSEDHLKRLLSDCISMLATNPNLNTHLLKQLRTMLTERISEYNIDEDVDDLWSFLMVHPSPFDSSSGNFSHEASFADIIKSTQSADFLEDDDFNFEPAASEVNPPNSLSTREENESSQMKEHSYHSEFANKLSKVWNRFEDKVEQTFSKSCADSLSILSTWNKFLSILSWKHLQQFLPSPEVTRVEKLLFSLHKDCRSTFSAEMLEPFGPMLTQEALLREAEDSAPPEELYHTKHFIPYRNEDPSSSFAGGHCDILLYSFGDAPDDSVSEFYIPPAHTIPHRQSLREKGFNWMDLDTFVSSGCSRGTGLWLGENASSMSSTQAAGGGVFGSPSRQTHSFQYDPTQSLQQNYHENAQLFLSKLNILQYPKEYVETQENDGGKVHSQKKAIPESVYDLKFCFFEDLEV